MHYPVVPSFDYPLPVLLVDLDEMPGVRVVMNGADSALESFEIGARVRIEIRHADEPAVPGGLHLPFAIVEPVQ